MAIQHSTKLMLVCKISFMQFASQIQLLGSYILIKLFLKKKIHQNWRLCFKSSGGFKLTCISSTTFFFSYFTLRKKILRRKLEKKTRGKAGSNIFEDIWLKGYEKKKSWEGRRWKTRRMKYNKHYKEKSIRRSQKHC